MEAVGPTAPSTCGPVGDVETRSLSREVPRIRTKVDVLEGRMDASIAGLEATITKLRTEAIPHHVNEIMTQMTNMAGKFADRTDRIELEIRRVNGERAQPEAPPRNGFGSAGTEHTPWGFQGTGNAQPGGGGFSGARESPTFDNAAAT